MYVVLQDRLIAKAAEDEYFNMLGDHETEGIELKYGPGEKELQKMLDMLAVKGRPGRKPKNPAVTKTGPMVKVEKVEISVASDSNQPLDLTRSDPIKPEVAVKRYDAKALWSALASANAHFTADGWSKMDEGIAENKENKIMRVG